MKMQTTQRRHNAGRGLFVQTVLVGAAALTIGACSGSSAPGPVSGQPVAQQPPVPGQPAGSQPPEPVARPLAVQGYYHGNAMIEDIAVDMDMLVVPDGQLRMRIGEASDDFGLTRLSWQFVGAWEAHETGLSGTGLVIEQGCAGADAGASCGTSMPAVLELLADGNFGSYPSRTRLAGTLEVSGPSGPMTWSITTGWLDQAYTPAGVAYYPGQYLARPWVEITSTATVLSIDAGSLFLQSPVSGCVVNGQLLADLHVSVTVDSCGGAFSYLNGDYDGLASAYCWDPWEYGCYGLSIWFSSPPSAAQTAAVTITADWQP